MGIVEGLKEEIDGYIKEDNMFQGTKYDVWAAIFEKEDENRVVAYMIREGEVCKGRELPLSELEEEGGEKDFVETQKRAIKENLEEILEESIKQELVWKGVKRDIETNGGGMVTPSFALKNVFRRLYYQDFKEFY